MKITSVRKNTVCSSQVSTLTISIITKVLFSSCAAKILHVWDTGMKEADDQHQHSQKAVKQQNKREIFQHFKGSWQSPAQVSTQEMLAGKRQRENLLAREGQAIEEYSLKSY